MIKEIEKRPFSHEYETKEHREIEKKVVREFIRGTKMVARKLPKREIIDFVLTHDSQVVAFLEVRSRRITFDMIDDFFFPFKKFEKIRSIYQASKKTTHLAVDFKDRIVVCDLGKHDSLNLIWWGDTRNDKSHDREVMVAIPSWYFRNVKLKKEESDG